MAYLFWAYTLTWVLIFAYTLVLGHRQKKLHRELEWLAGMVDKDQ